MRNPLTACLVLLAACSLEPPASPAIITPIIAIEPELVEIVETPDAGEPVAAPDAGEPVAAPTVAEATRAQQPLPYRNPRYIRRCRRESRRDAPAVEAIVNKPEARARARALARAGRLDDVLILSRIAYGETGTPVPGRNDDPSTPRWDEVEAFLAVLDGRRGLMSRAEMFAAYSPRRVFPHPAAEENPRNAHIRNMWIAELQLDGSRPPSWPRERGVYSPHPTWRRYGCPRWLATVDAVRRTLRLASRRVVPVSAGERTGPCAEQPDHWGGRVGIDDHAVELGWRLVNCGHTNNRFWVVPLDEGVEDEPLPEERPMLEQAADDESPQTDELREAALPAPEGVLRRDPAP